MNKQKKLTWSNPVILIIIVGAILLAAIIGMLLIEDAVIETDVTANTTKVGLVLAGLKDDANYSQAHYDSLMNLRKELNLKIICKDGVPEDASCYYTIKDLIELNGCKIIVAPSFGYGEYIKKLAENYPDVYFIDPTGTEYLPNMVSCMGRMYQARYLSGIVAGMKTKTGELGYAAAFEIPEVICQINAFALGVRTVFPEAVIHVTYFGSWTDDAAAKKASGKLLDKYPDIDVLTMHTNSLMPDRVAAQRGIWSIGFNMDNAALFPDSYLTACVWYWDDYYRQEILSCLQGKFYGRHDWIGMEEGIVALSDLTKNCAPGTKEKVDEAKKLFESRTFDVFYGPVTDNTGAVRIPEGESMSDDGMRNSFDWYVEGVIVEE